MEDQSSLTKLALKNHDQAIFHDLIQEAVEEMTDEVVAEVEEILEAVEENKDSPDN